MGLGIRTTELGIPAELYATVFEGNAGDNVPRDDEAFDCWKKCFPDPTNRILDGSKKDNFWEMGETGPCGPCSEIHVDIRDDKERSELPGYKLINKDHPLVVEIWNLVFIQYNAKLFTAHSNCFLQNMSTPAWDSRDFVWLSRGRNRITIPTCSNR